jgi:hypothetical protein
MNWIFMLLSLFVLPVVQPAVQQQIENAQTRLQQRMQQPAQSPPQYYYDGQTQTWYCWHNGQWWVWR